MGQTGEIELVHRVWEAMASADATVLRDYLAPDAKWRGVFDSPFNCEDRNAIIAVLSRNLDDGLRGSLGETIQYGSRVVVAFSPDHPRNDDRPLDDGIAYTVVTVHNGAITELKGCADRAAAESYARGGTTGASSQKDHEQS